MMPVPPALMKAFEDRAVIPSPELCRLLSIDYDTLRRHIASGRIGFINIGAGDVAPRKGFTLHAVMRFLEGQSRTVEPQGRAKQPAGGAVGAGAGTGFRAQREQRIADRRRSAGHGSGTRELLARVIAEKPGARSGLPDRREAAATAKATRRRAASRKPI